MEPVANIHLDDSYKSLIIELSVYIREEVFSEAALECTRKIIEINEGYYTAWSFRRKILFSLKKLFLNEELEFIKEITLETPKNYQLWQHRQIIVEKINMEDVFLRDLEDTKVQLSLDAKNIHCWQYRQWIIRRSNDQKYFIDSELKYTDMLLNEDVYNNSAWNHRYFLIKTSEKFCSDLKDYFLLELNRIMSYLTISYEDNECFWNYLSAFIQDYPRETIENPLYSKLTELIGSPDDSENYLYLKFMVRFITKDEEKKKKFCEKLKILHPINRVLWASMSQN